MGEENTHFIILKQGTDIKMMNLILLKERESFDLYEISMNIVV